MADFWKGFQQGFAPPINNFGNLLSNMFVRQSLNNQQFKKQQSLINAKENKAQAQQEYDDLAFSKIKESPLDNINLMTKMSPAGRTAVNTYLGKLPHTKIDIVDTPEGKEKQEIITDFTGKEISRKTLEKIPEAQILKTTNGGITKEYRILPDGSRVLKRTTVDYNKAKKLTKDQEKEVKNQKLKDQQDLFRLKKAVADAISVRDKIDIFAQQATIKAKNANNGIGATVDPTKPNLAKIDYENKKNQIKFEMQKQLDPNEYSIIEAIDGQNPQDLKTFKDKLKEVLIKQRADGSLIEKDANYIWQFYALKTGDFNNG